MEALDSSNKGPLCPRKKKKIGVNHGRASCHLQALCLPGLPLSLWACPIQTSQVSRDSHSPTPEAEDLGCSKQPHPWPATLCPQHKMRQSHSPRKGLLHPPLQKDGQDLQYGGDREGSTRSLESPQASNGTPDPRTQGFQECPLTTSLMPYILQVSSH